VPISGLDLDAIQRRNREALAFATEQVGGSEYAPETVMEHFDQDVPALIDALGRAFAVIRQNAITQAAYEQRLTDGQTFYNALREIESITAPLSDHDFASADDVCNAAFAAAHRALAPRKVGGDTRPTAQAGGA
jgi:hypothetical protein